jgi:hypothetical protein
MPVQNVRMDGIEGSQVEPTAEPPDARHIGLARDEEAHVSVRRRDMWVAWMKD